MACDPNGRVDVPNNDKKVLNQIALRALTMIGGDAQVVDNDLLKLGFQKTVGEQVPAPERFGFRAKNQGNQVTPLDGVVGYTYNIPDKYIPYVLRREVSSEDMMDEIVGKKRVAIVVSVLYREGIFVDAEGQAFVSADVKGVNDLFVNFSNDMYAAMPEDAHVKMWMGRVAEESGEISTDAQYTDRAEYEKALAGFSVGAIMEDCYFEKEQTRARYDMYWVTPNERQRASANGRLPYCGCVFSFAAEGR